MFDREIEAFWAGSLGRNAETTEGNTETTEGLQRNTETTEGNTETTEGLQRNTGTTLRATQRARRPTPRALMRDTDGPGRRNKRAGGPGAQRRLCDLCCEQFPRCTMYMGMCFTCAEVWAEDHPNLKRARRDGPDTFE